MAISHSGGYVSAAFDTGGDEGDTILGASIAILAHYRGEHALHSHVTGILPGVQHSGLGRAMKLHQAAWAAERGIDWIVWTFDPLVRRNAWFNIAVLGVEVHGYLQSFYGEMTDAINAGDESDRLLVAWHVPSAGSGATRDGAGADDAELVPTPEDIVELRADDPAEVARWRRATRDALAGALDAGRPVVGFTRAGEYVIGDLMTYTLENVELRRIAMPLVAPFRTSFGAQTARDILLVRVELRAGDGSLDRGMGRVRRAERAQLLPRIRRRRPARHRQPPAAASVRRRADRGGRRGAGARQAPRPPDGQGSARDGRPRRPAARRAAVVRGLPRRDTSPDPERGQRRHPRHGRRPARDGAGVRRRRLRARSS